MKKVIMTLSFIFLFIISLCSQVLDLSGDTNKKNNSKSDTSGKSNNNGVSDNGKRVDYILEEKKKREEKIKKLKIQKEDTSKKIQTLKEEIKKIEKEISVVTDNLIKTLKPEELEKLKEKKSDLLLKKSELSNKLVVMNNSIVDINKEINKKDDGYVIADGTLNWNKTFDIKKFEKSLFGTWSVSVIAKDDMNNTSREESINIKIDPKSDIPVLNIINPRPDARIPGNLMIVGTALDDDAVGKIIMFLDGEKKQRDCIGTDFWYYNLDTTNIKDGLHNLRFKVFDINGVASQDYSVNFNLDRRMPGISIDNVVSGAIVSGKLNIKGKASDDNGITKLEYSIDDRYSFIPIINKKSLVKDNSKIEYLVTIDSDKLVDGIQTIWFRAIDKTESVGYFPLTITVDHKPPAIEFQYPKNKDKIGDRFIAYGVANDDVEMKHIIFRIEGPGAYKKDHKVIMLPGNPYWSFNCQSDMPKLIDAANFKDGIYKITAIAEDVAGNKKTSTISVYLDREIEKPILNLTSLKENDSFSSNLPLYGSVNDDDGMKEVIINIFKEGKKEMVFSKITSSSLSFSDNIDIYKLDEGKYRLELIPADYYVKGNPINVPFWIDRSFPKFDTDFINKEWSGKTLNGNLDLAVRVIKYGELKSVKYSLIGFVNNNEIVKDKELKILNRAGGTYTVENIKNDISKDNPNLPQGIYIVKLTAEDVLRRKSFINIPVVIDSKEPLISELKIDEKTGMTKNEEINIKDNLLLKETVIEITNQQKVILKPGEEKSFELKTKSADGKNFNSYKVNVIARDLANNEKKYSLNINFKDTKSTSHILKVVTNKNNNDVFGKSSMVFVDKDNNSIDNISSFYSFAPYPITNMQYKIEDKETTNFTLLNKENGIYFAAITNEIRKELKIGNNNTVFFAGEDVSGDVKTSQIKSILFNNDLNEPYGKIFWPPSYVAFNEKKLSFYGVCNDDSNNVTITCSFDSTNDASFKPISAVSFSQIENDEVQIIDPLLRDKMQPLSEFIETNGVNLIDNGKFFKTTVDLSGDFIGDLIGDNITVKEGEHRIYFKIKDSAEKEVMLSSLIYVDRTLPQMKIWNPTDNEILNGKISIRGEAKDNYYLANTVFTLNEGKVIADGRFIWDGLYDLYKLDNVDIESEDTMPINIDVYSYDSAGNKLKISKTIKFDTKSDRPVVYINSPAINDQRFSDFIELGGVALDDDGIEYVDFRLDDGMTKNLENGELETEDEDGWVTLELEKGKPNWNVKIDKNFLPSGRHKLEVRAYDISGVRSESKFITFQLDKENPEIRLFSPPNGSYLQGEKLITGKASDPNDIEMVEISTSNGWTFVSAEGKESWKYYLNSNSIPDGTLKFLIKARDNAGSESFSFAVYNIDNKPPQIDVLLPKDGFFVNNKYKIIGRATDNIGIDKVMIKVTNGQENVLTNTDEEGFAVTEGKEAWEYSIDVKDWTPYKTYHLVAKVYDLAGNKTEKTLDFTVNPLSDMPVVELDQPQSNQHLTGDVIEFLGTAKDDDGIEAVYIKIDDEDEVKADGTEVWRYILPTAKLKTGTHKVVVVAQEKSSDGKPGKFSGSISRSFYFDESGPVITVLSHLSGAPMEHRPWLMGKAYYYEKDLELKIKKDIQLKKYNELRKKFRRTPSKIPNPDDIEVKKYEITPILQKYLAENMVKSIHLTLDNGNTYEQNVGFASDWMVRVQTQYLTDGEHTLQLKATTLSGKESVSYFKVVIDRNLPKVIIDKPFENSKHNDKLIVMGSADDNSKVTEVKVLLKRFDKNVGKVPKFIQGLYLWAQGLGGPTVSGGFGLSFFDDVVRLEGLFGWIPTKQNMIDLGIDIYDKNLFGKQWGWKYEKYEPRFPGFVTGGKLLAKVVDIPFEFFWGEDAKNFSWSLAIGAGFYWFSGFGGGVGEAETYNPSKQGKVLAGFMYQFDLFKIERFGPLRKFAIYFENSFYFIASEVQSELLPQVGFGIRNSFF